MSNESTRLSDCNPARMLRLWRYHLKPGAALFATVGFRPIPVDEIGLYQDTYRASWPVVTTPEAVPDTP